MGFEQTGVLYLISETTQVSARFTKREFVLTVADNPKYPQQVQFQLTGDRVSQLDGLQVGDEVRVEFSLRGREWTSPKGEVRYFNSLDAWRVEPMQVRAPVGGGGGDAQPNYSGADPDYDGIPFCDASPLSEPGIPRAWRGRP